MNKDDIANMTDAELIEEMKRSKKSRIFDAVMTGGLLGIAIYSAANKGISWVILIPLAFIIMTIKNEINRKKISAEVQKRGLG